MVGAEGGFEEGGEDAVGEVFGRGGGEGGEEVEEGGGEAEGGGHCCGGFQGFCCGLVMEMVDVRDSDRVECLTSVQFWGFRANF